VGSIERLRSSMLFLGGQKSKDKLGACIGAIEIGVRSLGNQRWTLLLFKALEVSRHKVEDRCFPGAYPSGINTPVCQHNLTHIDHLKIPKHHFSRCDHLSFRVKRKGLQQKDRSSTKAPPVSGSKCCIFNGTSQESSTRRILTG
jgi:hypothetical protein